MKTKLPEDAVQKLSLIAVKAFVVLTAALSMFMVGQQFMAAQRRLDAEPNHNEHATDIGEPKHRE